jgi:hypothetical protein
MRRQLAPTPGCVGSGGAYAKTAPVEEGLDCSGRHSHQPRTLPPTAHTNHHTHMRFLPSHRARLASHLVTPRHATSRRVRRITPCLAFLSFRFEHATAHCHCHCHCHCSARIWPAVAARASAASASFCCRAHVHAPAPAPAPSHTCLRPYQKSTLAPSPSPSPAPDVKQAANMYGGALRQRSTASMKYDTA